MRPNQEAFNLSRDSFPAEQTLPRLRTRNRRVYPSESRILSHLFPIIRNFYMKFR